MKDKKQIISQLRKDILKWEGYRPSIPDQRAQLGLGPIESAFPNNVFPIGTVHEFVCASSEQAATSGGFISGILSVLMQHGGACVWISRTQRLFAPALTAFGVQPSQVIFISLTKDKDALWVMEEALKCPGLSAVVCELCDIDFKQSRRLQLAVEHSHVTGFVLRNGKGNLGSTTCAARWQISPLPSTDIGGLPGLGFLRWQVDLLKVRNGQTGNWTIAWQEYKFVPDEPVNIREERQVG